MSDSKDGTYTWDDYKKDTKLFERDQEKPYGCIQWKGTDVCMDVHCICGAHGHIDGEFFYHYECAACHRKYAVGFHVPLIELTPEAAKFVSDGNACDFITDESVLDER